MSRSFIAASNQYLSVNQAVISTEPVTMACWFKANDAATRYYLMTVSDSGGLNNFFYLAAAGDGAGDPVRISQRGQGDSGSAESTSGFTADTWHHACGVFVTRTSRWAYIDGANGGHDSDTCGHPVGLNTTSIGVLKRSTISGYMDGVIAEAAIWDVALTAAEVAILGKGYCPLFVRPSHLKAYWPLIRKVSVIFNPDIVGQYDAIDINSPGDVVHCRVIRPGGIFVQGKPKPEYNIPVLMQHYRRMRIA